MDKISFYIDKCRCCLKQTDESSACELDENIANQISYLTAVELTISPKLSTKLCNACFVKINDAYELKHDVIKNQENLNRLLEDDCDDEPTYEILEVYEHEEFIEEVPKFEEEEIKAIAKFKRRKKDESLEECLSCNKTFPTKKKLKLHIARVHKPVFKDEGKGKDKNTICAYCGKILKGNNHVNYHIKTKHLNLKKFNCDMCNFSSYGKYEIRSHILIHHLPLEARKKYPCDQCSSILTTRMSLKTHKTHKHSGEKPHFCFCGKSFCLKETLKSHIRNVHNMERKYKCPSCSKGFNSNPRLNDHINNVHGKKQEIPCEQCGKIFNSLRNLQTHAVYHNSPKLKCRYCEKLFYIRKNLREHEESTHEGVTYNCNQCQRSFQSTSGLRRHAKSHCKG